MTRAIKGLSKPSAYDQQTWVSRPKTCYNVHFSCLMEMRLYIRYYQKKKKILVLKVRGKNKHNHWISISISPSGAIFDFHWEKKTSFQHWFWHVYSHKFKVLSLVYLDLVARYTYGSHIHHTIYELDLCMGQHFFSLSVTCLWSCIFLRLHACWRVCV